LRRRTEKSLGFGQKSSTYIALQEEEKEISEAHTVSKRPLSIRGNDKSIPSPRLVPNQPASQPASQSHPLRNGSLPLFFILFYFARPFFSFWSSPRW
jgi:hypothetical protein